MIDNSKFHQTLEVEKIFINGHIITMDEKIGEVEALAIGQGKILSIGTTEEIMNSFPNVEVVDLKGKTVMPGIIESHGHLLALGKSFLELNVAGIETPQEVIQIVREKVHETPSGQWIFGWGWDEGEWAMNYPTNDELNQVSPENPVYLRGLHGFASWVNDEALKIAGITNDTSNPPNGEILKDINTGKPTGILTNQAQKLLTKNIPPMTQSQIEDALLLAFKVCAKNGLTTVHEAWAATDVLKALYSLKKKNELPIRVYAMIDWRDEKLMESVLEKGPEIDSNHMLTIRSLKIFVDGALGSRGAAMIETYSDAPDEKGLIITSEERLLELTIRAMKSGLQVIIHAIGDRANRITLDVVQRAIKAVPEVKDHRLRIEHAQVVALEDIPKFAPLGIVLSMQPPHSTSDMPWAETRVGPERIKGAYAWRSFLDTGIHLTLNSDFPGEKLNPFYGMYTAMTRQTSDGKPEGGWYPDQCLSREEVLKGYTIEAAYSGFEEDIKGKLLPGMLADFIVLSDDILNMPVQEFLSLYVEQTYVAGEMVYKNKQST